MRITIAIKIEIEEGIEIEIERVIVRAIYFRYLKIDQFIEVEIR